MACQSAPLKCGGMQAMGFDTEDDGDFDPLVITVPRTDVLEGICGRLGYDNRVKQDGLPPPRCVVVKPNINTSGNRHQKKTRGDHSNFSTYPPTLKHIS